RGDRTGRGRRPAVDRHERDRNIVGSMPSAAASGRRAARPSRRPMPTTMRVLTERKAARSGCQRVVARR
ncbi:MAG: hypothetical protein ACRDSN_05210, partial [Pseudonocardiaceae bacterium]